MSDPDRKIWDDMLSHLRANHSDLTRQWFAELEPLGVRGGQLLLRAHTDVHRDYLRRQCGAVFNEAALVVSQRLLTVRFLGPNDDATPAEEDSGGAAPAVVAKTVAAPDEGADGPGRVVMAPEPVGAGVGADPSGLQARPARVGGISHGRVRRDESLVINPDYSFENFVVGPGNRLAHAASVAVGNDPGHTYNPLFIHGGVGLGKTHLLQAVCLRILESNPKASMYYISCESFATQFFEAVAQGEMADFRHRFRDVDVLVIDDIHFLTKRDRTQEEFFHTFNDLYQDRRQIVLSSDAPPEEIPDLEDRLVSRFKCGLVAKVDPPCQETREAIVKSKARVRGIELPDNVAWYVAMKIDTNIRELEGAVTRIQIQASVEGRPIDLQLARAALGDTTEEVTSGPTIQAIVAAVTEFYGLRVTDLQSKRRHRSVTVPRQVCMYLVRKLTRNSLEETGGYFGGRDHTTVMHAVKTVNQRSRADPEFATIVRTIEERIRPLRMA